MGGDGRILALLSGNKGQDQRIREALARVDAGATVMADAGALTEEIRAGDFELIVCDERVADPRDVLAQIQRDADVDHAAPPVFLSIVDTVDLDTLADTPAYAHYLCRPFRSETLAALCRALLETPAADTGDDRSPTVAVRRPARFSARPLYADAVRYTRESLVGAREGLPPDMGWARLVAERLHTSLVQSNLLLNRALEPYKRFEIPIHCVNVAIFAGKIALGRDLPLRDTLRAIQAGLLHDIGMARLPESILHKEGTLTDEERAEMERHPLLGADLVAALGPDYGWLQHAVRQEHERASGQGYPDGLAGDDIDPLARIIGVADVFEAFSHARDYRSPFTAFEALERVVAMRDEFFDGAIIDALANEISVFPLDSYVKLSSGAIGRVIATNPDNLMRPTIEVLWDESWAPIDPRIVALDKVPDLTIERPLHESEVPIT